MLPVDALALGAGAFFGAASRYHAGRLATEFIATDPKRYGKWTGWHTAGINIAGSFLLGGIAATPLVEKGSALPPQSVTAWHGLQGMSPRTKLMMGVGFCGRRGCCPIYIAFFVPFSVLILPINPFLFMLSFTTFSTFSVDVVGMLAEGKALRALSYVATNNVGGIMAAGAGVAMVKRFF